MGQAKNRGTYQERLASVKERIFKKATEEMPQDMRCNQCNGLLTDITSAEPEDIKFFKLTHLYAGHCSKCNCNTFAFAGTHQAMADFTILLEDQYGDGLMGVASSFPNWTKSK